MICNFTIFFYFDFQFHEFFSFCKFKFLITGDDEENVTWATDVSEDAVRERMTELSLGVKALAVDDDIEKSEPEKLNILFTFAKKALDKGKKYKFCSVYQNLNQILTY